MTTLRSRRVWFFSQNDETAFFEFAGRIRGIRKIEGVGDSILLHVSARLSDRSLQELISLFRRYNIQMSQLAQFLSESNRPWFTDPKAFWHKRVFRASGQ